MKYIDEFRNRDLISKTTSLISKSATGVYNFMEVCGGHTAAIHRFGIPSLLPGNVKLLSGPGCPVCVTESDFIDKAIAYSGMDKTTIATFGDLIRVPGSESSLEREMATGADVRIVFSALEALEIARNNPGITVIFLGIGFETTAPGTAVTLIQAAEMNVSNFLVLSAHKIMPPAMENILQDGTNINGFICPGHVATITGSSIFDFIPARYKVGCVIAGFEPLDILISVLSLIRQANNEEPRVDIEYSRAVSTAGNTLAKKYMNNVFDLCDATWRGLGMIPRSGLKLNGEFERFDAEVRIPLMLTLNQENGLCICGKILKGSQTPPDCTLFGEGCVPDKPVGACMVSAEGACNSWYKYRSAR